MDSQASLDIFGSPSLSSSANMTGPNAHCVRYAPFVFPVAYSPVLRALGGVLFTCDDPS